MFDLQFVFLFYRQEHIIHWMLNKIENLVLLKLNGILFL